jgi:sugar phosphate isomerase/epimerase
MSPPSRRNEEEDSLTRPLGLHQTTAMDLGPVDLIKAAAAAGYDHVSLFTHNPVVPLDGHEDKFVFPKVTEATKREVLGALDAGGLHVVNAEFFLMRPDIDLATYGPGLALARELGARHAVSHVFETEPSRAVDILGAFCDLAEAHDLTVAIEFCQMTPGCKSIEQAAWFVDQVGKANLGFGICPMHLVRSGGTAADVAQRAARTVLFGQVNDGRGLHSSAAYFDEVHDRELPGNGDFPLRDILAALPADAPIEVKIPRDSRIKAGEPAKGYIAEAYARTRPIIDDLARSP